MDMTKKTRELISALCDDEIPEADQELALAALDGEDGRQAWDLYHRIGDGVRAADALRAASVPDPSPGFTSRLAERLAAEPLPGKRTGAGDGADPTAQLGAVAGQG